MPDFDLINLEKEFNHKAILEESSQSENNGLADQGVGRIKSFFRSSNFPESHSVFHANNIPFLFPNKNEKVYDNIKCNGQKIILSKRYCSKVYFISFNDFIESDDIVELLFECDISETQSIKSLPWGKAGMYKDNDFEFVNKFFKNYQCILQGKNTNEADVGCTLCSIDIANCNKELYAIQLPDNPILHIFSITFELFG